MKKLKLITLITLIQLSGNLFGAKAYDQNVQDLTKWCNTLKTTVPNYQERSNIAQLIFHLFNSLKRISDNVATQIKQEHDYFETLANNDKNQSPEFQNAVTKIKTLISSTLESSQTLLQAPVTTLTQKMNSLSSCYSTIMQTLPAESKTVTLQGSKHLGEALPSSTAKILVPATK